MLKGMHSKFAACTMFAIAAMIFCCDQNLKVQAHQKGNAYYLSNAGSDTNAGTIDSPWKTIDKLNTIDFNAGDTVYFETGQTFGGTLQLDSADSGTINNPVVITSSSGKKASIHAGNFSAIVISSVKHLSVQNLRLIGAGRKEGNTQSGIVVQSNSRAVSIDSVNVEGFQKSGVLIYIASDIVVENVHAHNNGGAGILVAGSSKKSDNRNILIKNCLAENNPGDPTMLDNHSGNGIIVGLCTNVTIEYCVATNNGWDMPRIGNGPVGIWTYESDGVTIQHCISYRNRTSKGGEDGGGFDLDGGVTNSVIQYCLSYENEGAGFGIFQYNGASSWKNNTVRFNISENDGLVSRAHSGIFIWNGSGDENQFRDFYCYNNVIVNNKGNAIYFDESSARTGFRYYNNIFVAKDQLTRGKSFNDAFVGNNWWSMARGFNMNGEVDFATWVNQSGQEKMNGVTRGMNVNPAFENLSPAAITNQAELSSFIKYKISAGSPLRTQGIDLKTELGIDTGNRDFNQNPLLSKSIGASF